MSLKNSGEIGPFGFHEQMYAMIDATKHGDVPWKCFTMNYAGEVAANGLS